MSSCSLDPIASAPLHEGGALPAAKRRALRRRSSSGGTMFVVAMTIAVLSTIGAWALQSAALEVRMAGFERQSSQTHYLSEYGLLATTDDLQVTGSPGAQKVVGWAMCGASVGGSNYRAACLSLPCLVFPTGGGSVTVNTAIGCAGVAAAMPVAMACYRWEGWTSVGGGFPSGASSVPLMDVEDGGVLGTPGSLGATNMTGSFSTEITELGPAPAAIAGFSNACVPGSGNSMCTYFATVTSYGQTSATGASTGQGSELLRARVEVGPIPTFVKGNCQ